MTLPTILREADFVVTIFTNVIVLLIGFPAYKRTRMSAFAWLIWGGFLGIVLSAALRFHSSRGFLNVEDDRTFYEVYRIGYIVVSVLWTGGVVKLVRKFIDMIDKENERSA